jgi:hypothetical protein
MEETIERLILEVRNARNEAAAEHDLTVRNAFLRLHTCNPLCCNPCRTKEKAFTICALTAVYCDLINTTAPMKAVLPTDINDIYVQVLQQVWLLYETEEPVEESIKDIAKQVFDNYFSRSEQGTTGYILSADFNLIPLSTDNQG